MTKKSLSLRGKPAMTKRGRGKYSGGVLPASSHPMHHCHPARITVIPDLIRDLYSYSPADKIPDQVRDDKKESGMTRKSPR